MFDYDAFLSDFRSAASARGFVCETIAVINGDPVDIWVRPAAPSANRTRTPRLFVSCGIHGDEPAGPLALLRYLVSAEMLSHEIDWVLIPAINPSGLRLGTRENADGIDLNRDFLDCNTAEIVALVKWYSTQAAGPDAHFSLHEDWEARGFYMYAINTGATPCYAAEVLAHLAPHFKLESGGPVDGHDLLEDGLIHHEAVPDEPLHWPEAIWLVKNFRTLSYTFEAPGGFTPQMRVDVLHAALHTAVALFLERV